MKKIMISVCFGMLLLSTCSKADDKARNCAPVNVVAPAFPSLKAWAKQQGIAFASNEQLIKEPKVLDLYKSIRDKYNPLFNQVEQVKKFELLPGEWSIESGEMTPKMSLKRKVVMEKYKDAVDRIYD